MKRKLMSFRVVTTLILLSVLASCGDDSEFTQQGLTESFVQSFNPPYVDILFMVNDRSPMHRHQEQVFEQAKQFFARLEAIPDQYRMAIVSHDMEISNGRLQPRDNPFIIEKKKGVGTADQRASIFKNLLGLAINLRTGAVDRGLESVWTALNLYFQPRPNVPLVLVFISDSDDHSEVPSGTADAVEFYKKAVLSLKGGKTDLVRAYSINYLPLNGKPKSDQNRCATFDNADIDLSGFQDRYFRFAKELGGVPGDKATGDLCGPFADLIDLSGLKQLELPRKFKLQGVPAANSLIVSVFKPGGEQVNLPYTYDPATNEIVFEVAPPEGTTITVTFLASK